MREEPRRGKAAGRSSDRWWPGALGLGHVRAYSEVVEDLLDDSGILDGCYQAHWLVASGTVEYIEQEKARRIKSDQAE